MGTQMFISQPILEPVAPAASQAVPAAAARARPGRLFFVDNIRVLLTILVILHHLMITYAGTGDWIYNEGREDLITNALGGWFCATNQSYFMGLFLLISAYFVPGSYDRKGPGRLVKDRLIRLGIPLALYSWVINPLFVWAFFHRESGISFWSYFPGEYFRTQAVIGHGPLWFVEVLLIFTLVYVGWRLATRSRPARPVVDAPFPANRTIALFALLLGVVTFLVRLPFPMDGYWFGPLNLQFGFFAQYIALFSLGLIAYRRNWLVGLPDQVGRFWLRVAIGLILLWAPMMLTNGAVDGKVFFKGGVNWQAALYAVWESFLCVSMCLGLIYAFRRHLNQPGKISGWLVPLAYTAYLIHTPLITYLAFGLRDVMLYPLLKFALVAPVAVLLCFGLSSLIRKIPYSDRVL
ncbi:MAG TPA: acyltransferase family protein [Anaerolineae bacterium]|nr:acyltransferase family protein [Anaerolineae bacterium]